VLYRIAECLALSCRAAEALPHLARLVESYPQSEFIESAKRLQAELAKPPSPPCAGAGTSSN
jgi:hypothetical protein